ncbi:MAG: phosphate signaling complex protein PhoU [Alphaproteobacteria bacterium]|nr:phosphate signaling complex protein PhoU [Alphaproteobacteria bacterium]MBU1516486.1 phosphate signaling complex protein PhoU [Alphaproteobacteria bacterium]MBU2094243.1 phosphate signaling complex protein PhoU [Alphaproteobacteria bacterium]MBU2154180.1 phosphate signaling complex protein PhoU [Alphaproteobacteria bacterium]MBU2307413.1 phosphate signaling complex protein PhoU [Alphaproteobacteria bacterium]
MDHTLKAVDTDLEALSHAVAAMGDLAVAQVRAAVDVFVRHDLPAAEKVVRADNAVDIQDIEIERNAVRFIALRQPMADDLRRPIAAMKIAMQLERCGDLAKNIAKRVPRLTAGTTEAQADIIAELGRMASERLAAVINAYRNDDAQGAYNVWLKDTDIDERHDSVVREIVAGMAAAPDAMGDAIHLLFIAKNLERIGDHATNVAELVHYQITGTDLSNRPKL